MTERGRTYRGAFAVLGALVLVMGMALVGQSLYFNDRLDKQSNCLVDSFAKLTTTLNARGTLTQRDAQATEEVILGVASVKTSSDFQRILTDYKDALAKTKAKRTAHPFPPFPKGKCG